MEDVLDVYHLPYGPTRPVIPCGRLREGHDFAFGPETSAKVRNVADPLRLRALL